MKRLLALLVVGLLVVGAGCAMTSPAADEARQSQSTTTAQTTTSGSNPHDTAPVGAMLPDGYAQEGITDASLAYQQHLAVLKNGSYHITYLKNASALDDPGVLQVVTNGSGPDQRWLTQVGTKQGPTTEAVYQDGNTQYRTTFEDDSGVNQSETAYEIRDGVYGNQTLADILSKMEVSSPRSMNRGNTTFIFYSVDAYDGSPVQGGHLVIYPSGQVRIVYLKYDGQELAYTTTVNDSITVQEPDWVGSDS